MVLNLLNSDDFITLLQFDISLPNGFIIKKVDGEYDIPSPRINAMYFNNLSS